MGTPVLIGKTDHHYANLIGEKKLLVGILRRSLEDLCSVKHRASAWAFFTEDKEDSWFNEICKMLSINPDLILIKVKDYYLYGKPFTLTPYSTFKNSG